MRRLSRSFWTKISCSNFWRTLENLSCSSTSTAALRASSSVRSLYIVRPVFLHHGLLLKWYKGKDSWKPTLEVPENNSMIGRRPDHLGSLLPKIVPRCKIPQFCHTLLGQVLSLFLLFRRPWNGPEILTSLHHWEEVHLQPGSRQGRAQV